LPCLFSNSCTSATHQKYFLARLTAEIALLLFYIKDLVRLRKRWFFTGFAWALAILLHVWFSGLIAPVDSTANQRDPEATVAHTRSMPLA
jgi:hypothetical protein